MTSLGLIDQKRLGQQNSSRLKRPRKIWKQNAIEKINVDDRVEARIAKRKAIEVGDRRPYGEIFCACVSREDLHRDFRKIHRENAHSGVRESYRIAAAARRDIEHDASRRQQRKHLDDERLGIARRALAAMLFVPLEAFG